MTVQKYADEKPNEHRFILRSIIDSANALIFSLDRKYRYTSFNKAHAAVMKTLYGAEIELGHSLYEYMTVPEDRERSRCNLDRALAGECLVEEAYSGEELRSRQYFQVSHTPVRTDADEIIGVVVLAQDMSERRRIELEILGRQQRLSELVGSCSVFENLENEAKRNITGKCADEELAASMLTLLTGKSCSCGADTQILTMGLATDTGSGQTAPALTRRELEVLKFTANGYNTKETAFELGVSVKMIETHRKRIKQKLGLKNVAQFVTYAARVGLISIN